ncbi:MAG TPA: hypothetical protein VE987_17810 [Polyangiaceae bacterium]|nr:hypothetical protein [Polyangiaceae bacterium]
MSRSRCWLVAVVALAACHPATIAEAEAKKDVRWLDEHGTPDAIAAIGRIADAEPDAVAALEARSSFDVQAFAAAWTAVVRGAPWGTAMIRRGLADPRRADLAASAMPKSDPRLLPFLPDLEAALVRLSASTQNFNVSSTLASIGPPAREAIERRIVDASTRGAMCRGAASRLADPDARRVLLGVPEAARDAPSCVDAVVRIAADDDAALSWMAVDGEPGLLGAAGKSHELPCPRLHVAWTKALASRRPEAYPALTVPLGYAVQRCTAEMDGVLADAIVHLPATRATVVEAIDPFGSYGKGLPATCAALPEIAGGTRDSAIVRERAGDALSHACKPPS